ncbi:MAG: class I SAM-dependent methyltransferase [Ignavibacteria bacterium]|nr:class I SAM-dependent methyltransferase [Ignavibacteria bacterium]
MENTTPEMQFIKERMKEVWSAGDFGQIAKIIEHEGRSFIDRLGIKPNSEVLDVACGNGNLAIPAARLGAQVTGVDIVPELIRQGNERAKNENLDVRFDIGDAEALPYADNQFDYVVTMFGAMFCPRPELAAGELFRVCKPGGTVAMANWTPEGFIGKFFKLGASYMPPPPGIPSPVSWGVEDTVRQRINSHASDLNLNRRIMRQDMQMSPHETAEHFIKYFGPTNKLYEILDSETRIKFKNDLIRLFDENNISKNGRMSLDAEYLEVRARKQ